MTIEIQEPLILSFYKAMEEYVRSNTDSNFKYLGDGFQITKEFDTSQRKNGDISLFLKSVSKIIEDCIFLISNTNGPKPDGFRVRIFSGFVFKLMVIDPNDSLRMTLIPEYVGYSVNTAHRILKVSPEIECLCDGSLPDIQQFLPEKFKPSNYPDGVDKEDVDALRKIKL